MMKLLMQTCVFLFMVFAAWGISDVLSLILDRWKFGFRALINVGLTLTLVSSLLAGMLLGAVSG
ncbi:hypothetical protein QN379_18220 [Glaciimonas sp. Gout2]|uniref:hypothetical protein n=1 Tax=unclassified Glaciimonas TaxID=2644401 RepID=UPI002B23286D|nr:MULTISPECIES: hypothetical protein [unclassified Glaciimonas]MEB0012597.1 hypothetical protein [Glaciimonas sp. Cout2]MEB0083948.1 hypothetical protein [Glaciimonas sp. Gout2]